LNSLNLSIELISIDLSTDPSIDLFICLFINLSIRAVCGRQLACLRAASAEELYNARHVTDDALLDWSPVQDGVELTGSPANLLASGQFAHNVTVLLGTNADEGSEFIQLSYDATFQESADYLTNWLVPELGNAVVNEYPPDAYNGTEDGKVSTLQLTL